MIFLLAFITRWVFFAALIISHLFYHKEGPETGETFNAALIELILYIPWNIVPVIFILYEHNRTFKNLFDHQNSMITSLHYSNSD